MPSYTQDGRAYIAGWIIKLLATAFLGASLAWAQHVNETTNKLSTDQAVLSEHQMTATKQLDRIENKVDALLTEKHDGPSK